jgi:hypothetical protein
VLLPGFAPALVDTWHWNGNWVKKEGRCFGISDLTAGLAAIDAIRTAQYILSLSEHFGSLSLKACFSRP